MPLLTAVPYVMLRPRFQTTGPAPMALGWTLALVALVSLGLYFALLRSRSNGSNQGEHGNDDRRHLLRLIALGGVWTVLTAALNIRSHVLMTAAGNDTAIFEQALWTTINGHGFFYNTAEGGSHFGFHVSPILFPVLLIYRIHPTFHTLLALGSLSLAISSLPLYRFARTYWSPSLAFLAALTYLAHPAVITQAAANDFHEMVLGAPLLAGALLELRRLRPVPFVLYSCALLTIREDTAFTVIALCLIGTLLQRPKWWLVVPAIVAMTWFPLCTKLLIPRYNPQGIYPFSMSIGAAGTGGAGIVASLWMLVKAPLATPRHLGLWYVLAQTCGAWLPLRSCWALAALPNLLGNVLVGVEQIPPTITSHRILLPIVPLLVAGWAGLARSVGAGRPQGTTRQWLLIMVAVNASTFYYWLRPARYFPDPSTTAARRAVVLQVPRRGAVLAPHYMLTRLARRAESVGSYGWFQTKDLSNYAVVVIDRDTPPAMATTCPPYWEGFQLAQRCLHTDPAFKKKVTVGALDLYLRSAGTAGTSSAGPAHAKTNGSSSAAPET